MVMVCTDAAARGIDIPHITHVVQSSFAASAVDFLHRVRVALPDLWRHIVWLLVFGCSVTSCLTTV